MKISTKARYGLRILIDIVQFGGDRPRMIREISESQGISQKYIGRLIIDLRKAGILRSVRGAKGGYVLKKKPTDLSILEIVEVMEGKMGLVKCVISPKVCKRSPACPSRQIWCKLTNEMRGALARTKLSDVACGIGEGYAGVTGNEACANFTESGL